MKLKLCVEAFVDTPLYSEFAQLDATGRKPDESTILRFRHRLEKHKLAHALLATVNALLNSQGWGCGGILGLGSAVSQSLFWDDERGQMAWQKRAMPALCTAS